MTIPSAKGDDTTESHGAETAGVPEAEPVRPAAGDSVIGRQSRRHTTTRAADRTTTGCGIQFIDR